MSAYLELAERCEAASAQADAALRATYGLPLAAIASDTHEGKIGLWCDNGLAGIGQIAILTDEFPARQAKGICALVNNMAALAPLLPAIAAALRARHAQQEADCHD